jgi:ADP-heptose:LPS heptosyltransferase
MTLEKVYKPLAINVLKWLLGSKKSASKPEGPFQNILIVRQHDQLGDMILCTPLFHALRAASPKSRITLIASPVNYRIMEHHPDIDRVICYDKILFARSLTGFFRFYRTLRKQRFDLAIVPATVSLSVTSDLIARFSGAPRRIGPQKLLGVANPTAFCYTDTVELDWHDSPRKHQSLRDLDILKPLLISTDEVRTTIGLTEEEQKWARSFLSEYKRKFKYLFGIHPGAGHPENRWHPERYAEIANRFSQEFNAGVVVTEGPMDNEVVRSVENYMKCEHIVIRDRSIREVAAVINELDLFVTNDTGIMHVAGAVSTNLLALFGPSDPLQWAPTGQKNRYVASKDKTMESLTVDEVYSILRIIIADISRNRPN